MVNFTYQKLGQLVWVLLLSMVAASSAFAPCRANQRCRSLPLHMTVAVPVPPMIVNAPATASVAASSSVDLTQIQKPLLDGIQTYSTSMSASTTASSSFTVALQERKIPTQAEIDQKKLTFNLWFWGGGFVAPFAATVFYFGFKFWEK